MVVGDNEFTESKDPSCHFTYISRHLFLDDWMHFNYSRTKHWYKSLRICLFKAFEDSFILQN